MTAGIGTAELAVAIIIVLVVAAGLVVKFVVLRSAYRDIRDRHRSR